MEKRSEQEGVSNWEERFGVSKEELEREQKCSLEEKEKNVKKNICRSLLRVSKITIFHTPVFKTLCSLCFPHSTVLAIHNSLYTTPHLACPSSLLPRAVSRPNSLLLLPRVRSCERIPFPFPVERLPCRVQRTPRFPQSTLFVFHTLHYTALSLVCLVNGL